MHKGITCVKAKLLVVEIVLIRAQPQSHFNQMFFSTVFACGLFNRMWLTLTVRLFENV